MIMWPCQAIAVLPVPTVSLTSQTSQRLPSDHLQLCLALEVISGESGPMAPFSTLPVPIMVPARNCSFFVSSPGLGGISGGLAASGLAASGLAASGLAAGFAGSAFVAAGLAGSALAGCPLALLK